MRLARHLDYDGRSAVELIARYPHRAPMVWEAALTPEGLSTWFPAKVDYEPRPGGTITFSGDPHMADSAGVVTQYEVGRRLAFSWGRSEITLVLTPVDGTTDLVLIDRLADPSEAARNAAGWHECVARLDRRLDVDTPQRSWHDLYVQYLQLGFPHGAQVPGGADLGR